MDEHAAAFLEGLFARALQSPHAKSDVRARVLLRALSGAQPGWDVAALREVSRTGAAASAGAEAADHGRLTAYAPLTGPRRLAAVDIEAADTWIHVAEPTAAETAQLAALAGVASDVFGEESAGDFVEERGARVVFAYAGVRGVVRGPVLVSASHGMGRALVPGALRRVAQGAAAALVDSATECVARDLRRVEAEVAAVEGGGADGMLRRLGSARRAVLAAWRGVLARRALASGSALRLAGMRAMCGDWEARLARAHAQYAGGLAVAQSRASMRLARVSARWMLLAAVLLPLQFAAGLFGMNIGVPWKHEGRVFDHVGPWLGIFGALLAAFCVAIGVARARGLV
ncbi:hypothetical protein IWW39_000611 [Coemansia spiralis]|uniref:Uncharacterized protein n=1 Tax=Coemansia spiralis TaxID=417178 RepID=A0A9W8GRL5_9FUNG|nr:hypothetical protein IWW39_000611 [Coemansia spiralis]